MTPSNGGVDAIALLRDARAVLLVDWPSREWPDSLVRLGLAVTAVEGPDRYRAYELTEGGGVRVSHSARPTSADIVYAYRPLAELPDIIALAREVGAQAVWLDQLDADEVAPARVTVESARLVFVSAPSLPEAATALSASQADRGAQDA